MNVFEMYRSKSSFNYNKLDCENREEEITKTNKILAFAYALKDTIGITIAGFPIRANELILSLAAILGLLKKESAKVYKNEFFLICLLGFNLIHTMIITGINIENVDLNFFIKYAARNILYIMLFFFFSIGKKRYSENDITYLCKTILIVNIIFMVLLYFTGYRLELGSVINTKTSGFQIMNIFGIRIPRFFGTATEAGYMGPFLMMPLYYYLSEFLKNQKNKKELIILLLMCLMTFSAIVYLQMFVTFAYAVKNTMKRNKKINAIMAVIITIFFILILYYISPEIRQFLDDYFINKLNAYLIQDKKVFDYSGTDRNMHMTNCINLFMEQPILKKLFGIGTGGYLYSLNNNTTFYSVAEEAYNIYLSTLLERGIIGIIIVICMVFVISRYHIKKDKISNAIYVGIVSQYIHWMITGNMWLCYFWMEVMYLIGYYYWVKKGNLCQKNRG